jgi:2-keto-myo-inositol isomerase
MNGNKISRRKAIGTSLKASLAAMGGVALSTHARPAAVKTPLFKNQLPIRVSLNTSTLMPYKLPVDQQIALISEAGFDGVELWMRDIMAYLEAGGSAADLREKLEAGNLVLENIIGFSQWCNDDQEERKKAKEQLREEMEIIAAMGGKYIAAPVMGIKTLDRNMYDAYAERFLDILALEAETGVTPVIELWGAGALSKLSDCAQITIATGHPKATMLLDIYHLYRGGNSWDTLDCLNGHRLPVIHMNDYPASPARETLTDADRVFPGDGVCPFDKVISKLYLAGFRGAFSVELFNKGYWESMDAKTILKNSYEKTVKVVAHALAPHM